MHVTLRYNSIDLSIALLTQEHIFKPFKFIKKTENETIHFTYLYLLSLFRCMNGRHVRSIFQVKKSVTINLTFLFLLFQSVFLGEHTRDNYKFNRIFKKWFWQILTTQISLERLEFHIPNKKVWQTWPSVTFYFLLS